MSMKAACAFSNREKELIKLRVDLNFGPFRRHRNDPMFSDRLVWANNADQEEQSDQGLHCLLFHLHLFDEIP